MAGYLYVVGTPIGNLGDLSDRARETLATVDLVAAERFYAGVLGLPVALRSEDRVWVTAGARTRIGLWTPQVGIAAGRGGVHVHYAMHIDEADYDGAVARLREHGYEPHEEDFGESGRAS